MHFLDAVQNAFAGWVGGWGEVGEAMVRLVFAAVAGALIGIEREVRGRQAGFRTNLLVCVGSCLTMLVSLHFAIHPWQAQTPNLGVNINVDPARVAYGVMGGIGFLGVGTIIHHRGSVRGLTTAAALWCVAAVGLAAGFGMYALTVMVTGLVVAALWLLDYVEEHVPKVRYRTVTVRRRWVPGALEGTVSFFKERGMDVTDVSFKRTARSLACRYQSFDRL